MRVENFGCWRDETIRFSEGINQIIGANESGKTTLFDALVGAIFGVNQKEYQDYRLTLRYTENDLEYELIRAAEKDNELVELNDSSGMAYEGNDLTKLLNRQFPGGEDIYRTAFCFTQSSPRLESNRIGRVMDLVTAPLFGSFDKPRVEQFLQTEINRIDIQSSSSSETESSPPASGELEMTVGILSNFLKEKFSLEESLSLLDPDLVELEKLRSSQSEMETAIAELEDKFEGGQSYNALSQRMAGLEDRLNNHVNNYSRSSQLTDDLGRVEKELGRILVPSEKESDEISERYEDLEIKAENSKREMDLLISRRGKANAGFLVATLVLVIVCLINILHADGTITAGLVDSLVPYTLPAVLLVWIIRLFSYIFFIRSKRQATRLFRSEMSQFDSYCSEINSRFHLKAADPIRAIAKATARHSALGSMAKNLKKTIGLLTQEKGLEFMKEVTAEIERELAEINAELVPLKTFAPDAARLKEIREELTARKVRFKSLEEQIAPLVEKCAPVRILSESIQGIDREIEKLKIRHNELSRQLEILKVTRTALKSASSRLIEKIYHKFNQEASEMLSRLAGREESQLEISEHNQAIDLKLSDNEGRVGLENLKSRSISTVATLAIKLVAASRIGSLPMLFDQADTGMDDLRFDLWQKQIAAIETSRQVIHISLRPLTAVENSNVINLSSMANQPSVSVLS